MGSALEAARLCERLLDQGPVCSWLLTGGLVFERVFGNAIPLFHKPGPELCGASLAELLPPENCQAWGERVRRVFAGESFLFREQHYSGAFSVHLFPVCTEPPEIAFAGGFAVDSTAWNGAAQELRNAALKVLNAREAERARLARFLHDEVGQCLSAAGLQLDLLRMDLESDVPTISSRTAEIQEVLDRVMEQVRCYTSELDASAVERAGLQAALDRMAGRLRRTFPGTLRMMTDSSLRLPSAVASAFFKIAEQAVDNAVRHSGCKRIEVLLKTTGRGPVLEVKDDGRGFDPEGVARSRGLGLLIMEHCAAEAGAALSVCANRPRGTAVTVSFAGSLDNAGE